MKNRLFFAFSLSAFLLSVLAINGCKDTATDPTYLPLAEIRFANYHQSEPIQIFMYPLNNPPDTISKTPTPMTYGLVTPYFNNLPTNRDAGMTYHLEARLAGSIKVLQFADVVLKPGDKKTWLISGNGIGDGGSVDQTLINDNPPAGQDSKLAYFRFMNVNPDYPEGLSMMIGDPLSGTSLATNVAYKSVSEYKGIPTKQDTSITFYVVSVKTGEVLSRLAGVGLEAGTYHTLTFGGAIHRIIDPVTGNFTSNDTVRIRILDDDPGTDLTLTPPLTFRFNIINALVPPNFPDGKALIDYTATGGLAIVINNNTSYDYKGLMPFTVVPSWGNVTSDGVIEAVPTTIPLVEKIYIKFVSPAAGMNSPSPLDANLFRFYAGSPRNSIVSDQLYTIIVFDTVKKIDAKAANNIAPYDSGAGTLTIPIPDVPIAGSARIAVGYMLAAPYRTLKGTSNNNAKFYVNDTLITKIGVGNKKLGSSTKTVDTSIVVPGGQSVTLKATVGVSPDPVDDYSVTFNAEAGAIYEAFLVGQRGRPDDPKYRPHFMVVRVNPK